MQSGRSPTLKVFRRKSNLCHPSPSLLEVRIVSPESELLAAPRLSHHQSLTTDRLNFLLLGATGVRRWPLPHRGRRTKRSSSGSEDD